VSHHTDARGAQVLAEVRHAELIDLLNDRLSPALRVELRGETVHNALIELVVATRRNDALKRCVRVLAGTLGVHALTPAVSEVLENLQADARLPTSIPPRPLPKGVSTPVGNDDPTVPRAAPVLAHEQDATRKVRGAWNKPKGDR
jgi:hypothetical protein